MAFAEDGEVSVVCERGVGGAPDAVGVAVGRGDVEDDAAEVGRDRGNGRGAPVGAAAQDEARAYGERPERRSLWGVVNRK